MPEKFLTIANRISLSFFLVVIIDVFFLNRSILSLLPNSITQFTWYYFIFGLPHIVASFVPYFSREYASYYKKTIYRGLTITFLLLAFFLLFLPNLFIYFFIGYTMYHVGWQQIGMCRKYIHNKNQYRVWSVSAITTAVTLALSVGGESLVDIPKNVHIFLQSVGTLSLLIFILSSIPLWKQGEYVITTFLIFALSAVAILNGYYIIGILMIRCIHDVSAFIIYIRHDTLYHKNKHQNRLYTLCNIQPKYIIIFLPLFAMSVSFVLQYYSNVLFILIAFVLSLMHYYLESIVWKRGTLHRNTLL